MKYIIENLVEAFAGPAAILCSLDRVIASNKAFDELIALDAPHGFWDSFKSEILGPAELQASRDDGRILEIDNLICSINNKHYLLSSRATPLTHEHLLISFMVQKSPKDTQLAKIADLGDKATRFFHDIRNPLGVIDFHLERQRESLDKCDRASFNHSLNRMKRASSRMIKLVNRINLHSKDELDLEPTDIYSIINNSITLHESLIETLEAKVTIDVEENIPPLLVRSQEIEQIFVNLLSNSLEAIEPSGKIMIRVYRDHSELVVTLWDNGRGIPAESRHEIFKKYYTTKKNGIGLGLSISRFIANTYKGSLSLEPQLPSARGSQFQLRLPIIQSEDGVNSTPIQEKWPPVSEV